MLALLVTVLLMAEDKPQIEESAGKVKELQKELKAVEGKWAVVKFIHPDRETTPDDVTVEFKGRTIGFDKSAAGEVVELDPATDPRCLDFKIKTGSGALRDGSA